MTRRRPALIKYKYDLLGPVPPGHPQGNILQLYPDATHLTPESLFSCWTFRVPREIAEPPAYVKRMSDEWLPEEREP